MSNKKIKEEEKRRVMTNNLLLVLIITFSLISLVGNFTIYSGSSSKITGYAVDSETTTIVFCILPSTFQNVSFVFPKGGEVLNGTIILNVSVEGEDSDIVADFYYVLDDPLYESSNSTHIGNDSYDGDGFYNVSWDTTTIPEGNYLFRINFTANNLSLNCRIESYNLTEYFTIDNIFVEPNWTNFYYNLTTNFSLLTRWSSLTDVVISNPNVTINYSGQTINLDSYSLDNNFVTPLGNLIFNTTACPLCINRSMTITLYNVTYYKPKVIRDGRECLEYCEFIEYSGNNLTFNTLGIGNYSLEENGTFLKTYDQSDPEAGSGQNFDRGFVGFFANFSYAINYTSISNESGAYCSIRFNLTGSYDDYDNMTYNTTISVFQYTKYISNFGTYYWQVLCDANSIKMDINNVTDNITILRLSENLTLTDQTDTITKYVDDLIKFYANYSDTSAYETNRSRPLVGDTSYCEISFAYNLTGVTGFTGITYNDENLTWTDPINMTYNSTSYLYEYERTFDYAGTVGDSPFYGLHIWNVSCFDGEKGFDNLSKQSQVKITNIAPSSVSDIPDITMEEETVYYLDRLNNYFSDADADDLDYSNTVVLNIDLTVDDNSVVKVAPKPNFFGTVQVIFYADDIYGARGESNVVNITVTDVSESEPVPGIPITGTEPPQDSSSGEGSDDPGRIYPECVANWTCTDWGNCMITNISTRSCNDRSNCGFVYKPSTSMNCSYVPTCDDLLKNQEETGVDCGGPNCGPCPTCSDNKQNQNENDIDCGGPCRPCPNCDDGLKNQNETGVDCGGPSCPVCKVFEKPGKFVGPSGLLGVTTQFVKEKTQNTLDFFNKSIILSLLLLLIITILLVTTAEIKYKFIKKRLDKRLKQFKDDRKAARESPGRKLKDLNDEIKSKDVNGLLDGLHSIISQMFYNNFRAKLNMSSDELINMLNEHKFEDESKEEISSFYKEIDEIRFSKSKIDKHDIRNLIEKSVKIDKLINENMKKLVKRVEKLKDYVKEIDKAISKHNQSKINKYYKKIVSLYGEISPEQRGEVRRAINKLDLRIKNLAREENNNGKH